MQQIRATEIAGTLDPMDAVPAHCALVAQMLAVSNSGFMERFGFRESDQCVPHSNGIFPTKEPIFHDKPRRLGMFQN